MGIKKKIMKKKHRSRVIVEGNLVTWMDMLIMVTRDVGLPPCRLKVRVVAAAVCKKMGWEMEGSPKEIIERRAQEMMASGAVITRPRRKSPWMGQLKRSPDVPRLGEPHPDYQRDDGFYRSRAWRELRLLALSNCRVCQACGARPPDVVLHVDHVQPRYKAPHLALSLENLQVLCEDCNVGKGAWSMADFRGHFGSI